MPFILDSKFVVLLKLLSRTASSFPIRIGLLRSDPVLFVLAIRCLRTHFRLSMLQTGFSMDHTVIEY